MATPRRPNPTPIPIPTPTPAPGDVRPPRAPTTAWDHANAELAALDASLPVALLPVRIETRFLGGDLVIRVYPDGLHADALKHSLTDAERKHADTFWRDSRADAAAEVAAWRALIDAVSSPWRAAWVIRATRDGASPKIDEREAVTTLRLLPKRWIVVGTLGGKQVVQAAGREIPANLIGGVDLNVQATSADALLNQPATSWVVDLDQAIAQGMALRIPLTGEAELVRTKGLDTLLVFGASAVSPEDQRTALAKLFLAHHYTRGVGLLRQGEPTNRDEHDADLLRPDVAKLRAREQAARRSSPQFTAFNGPAAPALARALGLDTTELPILDGGNDREQEFASAMNTIVWPITGGAILWHLRDAKGKQLVSGDDIKELRTHFIRDVRGAGPLPTLRIGKTPYGILPACALPEPVDGTNLHARMQAALHGLLGKWQKGVADLTTVDSRADDTASDTPREHALVEVLASQAWPTRFALRKLDPDSPMATEAAKAKPQLPEGTLALYAIRLGLLFTAGMKLEDLPPFGPLSLYPALCDYEEHVVPWAWATAELPPTTPTEAGIRGAPGIREAPDTKKSAQSILKPLAGPVVSLLDQILRIGRSLLRDDDHPASEEDRTSERAAIDAAVVVLRSAPEADRARILGQSLSLAATRLDAWITATATRRLVELRAKRPTDLQVGAWGVVHGLRPAGDTPPGGYALAPSLGQAAAAVALRSGHAAYSINGSSPFAVDLSSERVRLARWLFDGVRQGQSLGALLGQRYERLLHEHGADTLVAVTRSAALKARHRDDPPVHVVDGLLVARALAPITDATAPEQALTKSLVDEKALDRLGKAVQGRVAARLATLREQDPLRTRPIGELTPLDEQRLTAGVEPYLARTLRRIVATRPRGTLAQLSLTPRELGKIAVEPLLDALDALADTATFETTHRLLGGDRSAAGTVLASVDRGEAPPPALNSLDTPRGGVTVAHRVVLLLPASTSGGGWTSAASAAAMAEPRLEHWAASVLGAPDQIRLVLERHDATTGALIRRDRAHLAELVQLGALDFCRLAADGPWQDGPLAARVRVALDVAGQRIVFADDEALGAGQIGLSEAHAIAASLASSWRGGRSATPAELSPVRAPNESLRALDRLELSGRLESLKKWLDRQGLTLASVAQAERPALLSCFRQLIAFGVPALAPPSDVLDESVEQLRERLPALEAARAAISLAVTTALTALTKPGDDAVALKEVTVGLSGIVGDVPVLPLYKAGAGAARSPLGTVLPTDEATISGWFAQLARVRPRIDAFDAALRLAEVRHERPPFTLHSGQPGASQDDAWAATHRPPGDRPCLCITAVLASGLDLGEDLAAVAVDAWSERVPAREVLGGLALQVQSPAAQAPQVVLLATPAPGVDHWSLAELQRAAASALPLAKIRCITPDRLEKLGHLLPCIFLDGARVPIDTGGRRAFDIITSYEAIKPHG